MSSSADHNLQFCTQRFSPKLLEEHPKEIPQGNHSKTRLALIQRLLWPKGSVLHVRFIGGTPQLQRKVQEYAVQWSQYADITFTFIPLDDPDILVSLEPTGAYGSAVGTESKYFISRGEPSMYLGFRGEQEENEYSRVIIHEFGHALGCVHEHQSPEARIPWNRPAVYEYYARTEGWTPAQVDQFVLGIYGPEAVSSELDRDSIMMYPIDNSLTIGDYEVGWNRQLSALDKEFISTIYPKE